MNRKKVLQYILFFLTLGLSLFLWQSIDYSVKITEAGFWIWPVVWLSLAFLSFGITTIIIENKYILWLLSVTALLLSFIFIFSYWHFVVVFASAILLMKADSNIKKDMNYAIKINIRKSIHAGSVLIIFSLCLVLVSQYYFEVRDYPAERLLPRFSADSVTGKVVNMTLRYSMPELQNLESENLTVDQMILENQKEQIESINAIDKIKMPEDISEIDRAILEAESQKLAENNKKMILAESRKQLSQAVGRELKGDEKISDVFLEMINYKISRTLVPKIGEGRNLPIIPLVISIALFVAIFSVSCTIAPLWTLLCYLIFWIFLKTKVLKIVEVPAKIEMIK